MSHSPPKPARRRRTLQFACLALAAGFALPSIASAATADLAVSQTDNPDPARTGQALVYNVEVSNAGPDRATSVRLVDKLSPKVEFVGANSPVGSCGRKQRRVICSLGGLDSGATTAVVIRVRPTHEGRKFNIYNEVTVSTTASDPSPANDTHTERTTIDNPEPTICAGRVATIVGTNGNDSLTGTDGPDVIAGLGGDDHIVGLRGDDVICGSGGADVIRGKGGGDVLKGGGGNDGIRGGGGNDQVVGKGGNDRLKGGTGDDSLRGGRGSDRCRGGGGSDSKRSC